MFKGDKVKMKTNAKLVLVLWRLYESKDINFYDVLFTTPKGQTSITLYSDQITLVDIDIHNMLQGIYNNTRIPTTPIKQIQIKTLFVDDFTILPKDSVNAHIRKLIFNLIILVEYYISNKFNSPYSRLLRPYISTASVLCTVFNHYR